MQPAESSGSKQEEWANGVMNLALQIIFAHMRFQVLRAASMKFRFVFWDVLPCKTIVDRSFRGTCCLHAKTKAVKTSYKMNLM
jgi:hypothetical protein